MERINFEPSQENNAIFQYCTKNQQLTKRFLLGNGPGMMQVQEFKGPYLSAVQLLEMCVNCSVWKSAEDEQIKSLSFRHEKVYYQGEEITLAILMVMFLEDILCLSSGFKAIMEANCLSAKKPFIFFAQPMIQEGLKGTLLQSLMRLTKSHRDKTQIYDYTKKDFMQEVINQLSFALTRKLLTSGDMQFWLSFPQSFEIWKRVYVSCAMFARWNSNDCQNTKVYMPWLVIIRRRLLGIEQKGYLLLKLEHQSKLNYKIQSFVQWIFQSGRRGFLRWLIPFLFNENYRNTKRQFLFIYGPPSSGKTFFVKTLFPCESFEVKNRTFSHFSNDMPGDYELHLLLFDDPGDCQSKMNQLDPSVLLNLANYNPHAIKHALPVKYGFMNVLKGQVAIVSNRSYKELFSKSQHDPIKTRLQLMKIESPIPISISSAQSTSSFKLKEIEFDMANEFHISQRGADHDDDNDEDENEEEEEEDHAENGVEEVPNEEVLFYIMWRGIFRLLKAQLQEISSNKVKNLIPNENLANFIQTKDNNFDSLYNFLCHEISEKDLFRFVFNNQENPSYSFLT